jgi:catechol 2,3-dioxygenase-like lactoylglutathione lyase family enzyme
MSIPSLSGVYWRIPKGVPPEEKRTWRLLKFICPLIVVEDIAVSRLFYEKCLGQKIKYDFGVDVQFEGDFSIHEKTHFLGLLGDAERFEIILKSNASECYFETDEIEAVLLRLKQAEVDFIHEFREQPWGQRVARLYDPDGHIIEIGETMEAALIRLHEQGLSIEDLTQRTGMPREFVERVIQGFENKLAFIPDTNRHWKPPV